MKKILAGIAGVVVLGLAALFAYGYSQSQHADYGWKPAVARPTYASSHPRVVIDQAHHNAHTARGKYRPFARLLSADGCAVARGTEKFTPQSLEAADVLVIVNASGGSKPQVFGINIPVPGKDSADRRAMPAFSPGEVEAVRAWVDNGGSLLLIADHAPFGEASAAMAEAFGVRMHKGFVEVPEVPSDPMVFSRENGWLGEHPILPGAGAETAIDRVLTFTGQSLDGPPHAAVLLRLPTSAVEYVPKRGPSGTQMDEKPAGAAQAVAFDYGAGRVVVLGEAAMLTAQVYKEERFGMNSPDCDNRQLALNIIHWLTRTPGS